MPPSAFVIAEMGSCHDGDYAKACELVALAKAAGADAVKAQYWSSATRLADRRRAKDFLHTYEQYRIPETWLPMLQKECGGQGIEFMCTAYLPEDILAVSPYVKRFKVASFEALDFQFIDQHPHDGRPIVISLGMISAPDMPRLLERRRARPALRYLHCVSGYPTPLPEVNLATIRHYMLDGFSDHTGDLHMGADAVLAGAHIVEVHIQLANTSPENPDTGHSLTPVDLYRYIGNIRAAEVRLGNPVKCVQPSERAMLPYQVFTS